MRVLDAKGSSAVRSSTRIFRPASRVWAASEPASALAVPISSAGQPTPARSTSRPSGWGTNSPPNSTPRVSATVSTAASSSICGSVNSSASWPSAVNAWTWRRRAAAASSSRRRAVTSRATATNRRPPSVESSSSRARAEVSNQRHRPDASRMR
jgi:hypothetical protein